MHPHLVGLAGRDEWNWGLMPGPLTFRGFRKGCDKTQQVGIKVGAQKTPSKMVGMASATGLLHSGLRYSRQHVLTKGVAPWRLLGRSQLH